MKFESVSSGKDVEIIDVLLQIHSISDPLILDCTHNSGKMWKNSSYKPIRMDINSMFSLDVAADFMKMPFMDCCFDVVVFDPPFLPTNAASKNSSKIWEKQYGLTAEGKGREGDNVSDMFFPFLIEAKRILKKNGIILTKIADIIHNHRYQWQQVDFVNAVKDVGMTPCDMLIKIRNNKLQSSKWKQIKHLRRQHSYWIVVRNSLKCEA